MSRSLLRAFLVMASGLALALPVPAGAQANDMFPTQAAALKRARQLKCSGAFRMGQEWMPCKDFATYQQAVSRAS